MKIKAIHKQIVLNFWTHLSVNIILPHSRSCDWKILTRDSDSRKFSVVFKHSSLELHLYPVYFSEFTTWILDRLLKTSKYISCNAYALNTPGHSAYSWIEYSRYFRFYTRSVSSNNGVPLRKFILDFSYLRFSKVFNQVSGRSVWSI